MFGATNIVKHNFKENWVYSSSVIAFDEKGEWNFDFAENVIIFGDDNSSSSHADNRKTNFLVLGEGPTYGINGSFGTPEMMTINYNDDNNDDNYFFVNRKEILKFKANNENVNFPIQLCLGSISNKNGAIDSREVSLKGNLYDFSVNYNSIDKSNILFKHSQIFNG